MKFKIGNLYFWNSEDDLFGKLITYYNKKNYGQSNATHIGIITDVFADKVEIAEAGTNGIVFSYYENWWLEARIKEGKAKIGEVKSSLDNIHEIAKQYEGVEYAWLDIFMIALKFLGMKLHIATGPNAMICSEFVARVLYDASGKKVDFEKEYPGYDFDQICPEQIFQSKFVRILK
jgi:hypothetical protein